MKLCAACHQDLPKDKFSKKQWKSGAECQRRCTSCVRDNREVVQPPPPNKNKEPATNNNDGINNLLESMSMNENEIIPVSDEELFKMPPPNEDCPICFLRMPSLETGRKYNVCCGKMICSGCIIANAKIDLDKQLCPFCRIPNSDSDKEMRNSLLNRAKMNDAKAVYNLGCGYDQGKYGFPQDYEKALKLWHRAGDLIENTTCNKVYFNIAIAYLNGRGVAVDKKKARYYLELAATRGDAEARYNLGIFEKRAGNVDRALKHFVIGVEMGNTDSLSAFRHLFKVGRATKDDYAIINHI